MQSFIHLNLQSDYSITSSTLSVSNIIELAQANNYQAVVLADYMNMFASLKFYKQALQAGLKPIIGVKVKLNSLLTKDTQETFEATILIKNFKGYQELSQLLSHAYQVAADHESAYIDMNLLLKSANNLILLLGIESEFGVNVLKGDLNQALTFLAHIKKKFADRFFISISRIGKDQEEVFIEQAVAISTKYSVGVVISNHVLFAAAESFKHHDMRVGIQKSYNIHSKTKRDFTDSQYFKTGTEMQALFADIPNAVKQSLEIAYMCNLEFDLGQVFLPDFQIPESEASLEQFFTNKNIQALKKYLIEEAEVDANILQKKDIYLKRLNFEIEVITKMGFIGYFLIVFDFISWAKQNDIAVGVGRGSGAGSLVAFCLGITGLDPIKYNLLFERFLNPERLSMPDFDIDFDPYGRDKVIDYVKNKYGYDRVSQIITFGKMSAKSVVRDVARVLDLPYRVGDIIAKLIPDRPLDIKLKDALDSNDELKKLFFSDDEIKEVIENSFVLEGLVRNVGIHAGGLVISPSTISNFCPTYKVDKNTQTITHFDKYDLEDMGLVKFDFLGLSTLSIINKAVKNINTYFADKPKLIIEKIPLDDATVYKFINTARTTGVFQLESKGLKEYLKELKPDNIEDIIALIALYRPGPQQSGMDRSFINRKHGKEQVSYPDPTYQHKSLIPILKPTYGVIVYQEQVMQIAQILAGYSLGEADILRRAMGSKKAETMVKQRSIFVQKSMDNAIDEKLAMNIFDIVEKFAGYGFNRSHSAAYGFITYQTAYLKNYYSAFFIAEVLSNSFEEEIIDYLLEDLHYFKVNLLTPSVNRPSISFTALDESNIVFGLASIKGVGVGITEKIIQAYDNQDFENFFDFVDRVIKQDAKLSKGVLESLIKAGAFDGLHDNRASLIASIEQSLNHAKKSYQDSIAGQINLFDTAANSNLQKLNLIEAEPWRLIDKLIYEKGMIQCWLSSHPYDIHENILKKMPITPFKSIQPSGKSSILIAGIVSKVKNIITKDKKMIALVKLDNKETKIEVRVSLNDFDENKASLIEIGSLIGLDVTVQEPFNKNPTASEPSSLNSLSIRVKELYSFDELLQKNLKSLVLYLDEGDKNLSNKINSLTELFTPMFVADSKLNLASLLFQYTKDDGTYKRLFAEKKILIENRKTFNNLKQLGIKYKIHF